MLNKLKKLKSMKFKDPQGHPLENCKQFIDLENEVKTLHNAIMTAAFCECNNWAMHGITVFEYHEGNKHHPKCPQYKKVDE